MKYIPIMKDDYDKQIKLKDEQCKCYSAKKFKDVAPEEVKILGEVIKGESKKEEAAKLSINDKLIPVYDNGTFNKLFYKKVGYIQVEKTDGYIVYLESRIPLFIWLLLLLLALIGAIIISILPKPDSIDPYNPLPPVDSNVEVIQDNTNSTEDIPEGGGKVGIGYDTTAKLSLSTKKIDMEYTNSGVSNQDVVIELCVISDDNLYPIAISGRIPAGSKLNTMTLSEKAPILAEGLYNAEYKVFYYNSETGEKSLVSSDISDIKLTVKK